MLTDLVDCERCPLSQGCTPVKPLMSISPKIMIVGEKPNSEDDLFGEVFSGREGFYLMKVLSDAGFNKSDYHLTYCVKCYIKNVVKRSHVIACRHWLNREEEVTKPKTKIILGAGAAKMLIPLSADDSFENLIGSQINGYYLWYSAFKMLNSGRDVHERSVSFFKEMKEKANGNS